MITYSLSKKPAFHLLESGYNNSLHSDLWFNLILAFISRKMIEIWWLFLWGSCLTDWQIWLSCVSNNMTHITRKQTLRSLSLSYPKKDGCARHRLFWIWVFGLQRSYSLNVCVILKEGSARPRAPILLLVWQRQRPYALFSRDMHHMATAFLKNVPSCGFLWFPMAQTSDHLETTVCHRKRSSIWGSSIGCRFTSCFLICSRMVLVMIITRIHILRGLFTVFDRQMLDGQFWLYWT